MSPLLHLHLTFSGLMCILSLQGRPEQCPFTTPAINRGATGTEIMYMLLLLPTKLGRYIGKKAVKGPGRIVYGTIYD